MTQGSSGLRQEFSPTTSFNKRIVAYATAASAAGVSALALATPSEAKVVYTRTNQPLGIGITMFDLNHDGIPDFGFCLGDFTAEKDPPKTTSYCLSTLLHKNKRGPTARRHRPSPNGAFISIFPATSQTKRNQIAGSQTRFAVAYALTAGVPVGKKRFTSGSKLMAECVSADSTYCFGPWYNVAHHYLGLKFVIQGKIHYGWARLTFTGCCSATLTGYAYETVANKSILTGDIVGPRKPKDISQGLAPSSRIDTVSEDRRYASLGLLAAGAQGFAQWRKKKEED
jgi:hypothetical protein